MLLTKLDLTESFILVSFSAGNFMNLSRALGFSLDNLAKCFIGNISGESMMSIFVECLNSNKEEIRPCRFENETFLDILWLQILLIWKISST
jgi:hypothetical protein